MNHIQTFLKNKNMLIRIILSYLLVGLLVISVLTFVIASKVSQDLTDEINRSADTAIEQSYNTANILLNSTFENFGAVFASADIQMGFYNEDFDTSSLGRIGNKLYALSSTNPLIHSIYLLNSQRQLAFSSLSTVSPFDGFYDPQALELLDSIQPNRSGVFFPRHINYTIDGKKYERNLISLVLPNSLGKITTGAMILNLDQQTLQSMVMNGAESGLFQSMILNKQGTVITHTNSGMINSNLTDQPYFQQISDSSLPKSTFHFTSEGRTYRITYMKSDSLGWTFIGMVDYENLLGKVTDLRQFILAVTGGMLLSVLLLGGFFTRWIYTPIHRLITHVHSSSFGAKEQSAVSELDLLGSTFHYLEHKIQDLQWDVADYQSAKRNEVLSLLTNGGWSSESEMVRRLSRVGIDFEQQSFVAVVFRLDGYRELIAAYSQSDMILLKYAVANIAHEISSDRMYAVCFDKGGDAISLIANMESSLNLQEMTEVLQTIQTKVSEFLNLSVSIAIGQPVMQLTGIKSSWETACSASRYRLVCGAGSFITPDIETNRVLLLDNYTAVLEKQITDQLKLGDADKLREAVAQFIAYVRNAAYDEMMLVITQLLISTAKTAKSMVSNGSEASLKDIGSLIEQLHQKETIEEIEQWYLELSEQAVRVRDQQSQQKNKWIVDKIIHYIHEYYADPNLTVDTLVEVGGLSMNYMRKIFKDIEGQTITAYLTDYRFSKAKALLIETDLPANKIGELVGFDNSNYFYVSFKKNCGKTPDHYRKHHKFSAN